MNNWESTELRKVLHVKHGYSFKGEYFSNDGNYILITPGNFFEAGGFKYTPGKEKYYTAEYPAEYLCKKGDLVVAMTEQAAGLLGSTALVPVDNVFLHNQRIGLITFDEKKYDKLFLYYLFRTKSVREQISLSSTGSKVKHTSPERIYDVQIHVPALPIQLEIGRVLFSIDAKIELNNKINKELEAMAKLIYDYWFVQFDFPNEEGKPYKSSGGKMVYNEELKRLIPDGWEVKELSELGNFKNGVNYDPSNPGDIPCPIINVRNISASSYFIKNEDLDIIYLDESDVRKYSVHDSSIIIARSGIPGATRLISDFSNNTLYCGFAIHYDLNNINNKNVLFFFLKSIEQLIQSGSGGTIMKNVNQTTLNALKVVMPNNKEIIASFNRKINPLFKKMNLIQKENQELTSLRDWLLPMLMNGQVTVKEDKEMIGMAEELAAKYDKQ
ncbi:restriction endonuclease subunit S [Lentimicrobium sp. S6]|uniref:restriction endonuclease subunit S n=1 Tax=Lentimicrobium sp. S6 TaxID=2735872 RepID=UPI0015544F71|nr:restriction endonuclease subunit S [Lentimicrobium sp. S6]NPD47608.1 restriction endonuclease subunit S [Lentimicrobium sp. S6]